MASSSSPMDIDRASSLARMEVASSSSSSGRSCSLASRTVEHGDAVESNILSSSMDMANAKQCVSMEDILPNALLGEIFSHLCDARDLSRAALVNSSFRTQCKFAKNVRFNCKLRNVSKKSAKDGVVAPPVTPFKQTVLSMVKNLTCVETLRLEIDENVQQSRFKEDEVDRASLWLSESSFVNCWLPPVSETLTSLTLIDYGPQAIFHSSPLLLLLSKHCQQLRRLELRNMFLDSKGCSKMNKVTYLSLKCVKLMENGLQDISEMMPNLEHIIFQTVVGLVEARLKSDCLKLLCLTFATRVQAVKLESKSLKTLQLKMVQCPAELRVKAPNLEALALRMTKGDRCVVEFEGVRKLKEVLMGSHELSILQKLSSQNRSIQKAFLDVPCMIFDDAGAWRGVKPLPIPAEGSPPRPTIEGLRSCCTGLNSLSVGPGLWHCLEQGIIASAEGAGVVFHPWTSLTRLILHLVLQDKEVCYGLLISLVTAMPHLSLLEVYVHGEDKIEAEELRQRLVDQFPKLVLTCDIWIRSMKFDAFDDVKKQGG
ncbi:hypothetical protein Mapa_006650 [Marchantia paleacea]|nr:hypothetical protein Mapa_006650 [Marchantia paleacea]